MLKKIGLESALLLVLGLIIVLLLTTNNLAKKPETTYAQNEELPVSNTSVQSEFIVKKINRDKVEVNERGKDFIGFEYDVNLFSKEKIDPKELHQNYRIILRAGSELKGYLPDKQEQHLLIRGKNEKGYIYSAKFTTVLSPTYSEKQISVIERAGNDFQLHIKINDKEHPLNVPILGK